MSERIPAPHWTCDSSGEVSLEWWNSNRKLVVHIDTKSARYIKAWGPSVVSEMEDGPITSIAELRALYSWLIAPEVGE